MAIAVEEGLTTLTMPTLAKRLGVAVGGLYRYFPSKEALLVTLQAEALEGFAADLAAAEGEAERWSPQGPLDAEATALHRVARIPWSYLEDAARAPARHRLIDALLSAPQPLLAPEQATAAEAPLGQVLGRAAAVLEEAQQAGALGLGDAAVRTHVLWATVHGLDHLRKRDLRQPEALRVDPLARAALAALLRGWGAADAPLAATIEALPPLTPLPAR